MIESYENELEATAINLEMEYLDKKIQNENIIQ